MIIRQAQPSDAADLARVFYKAVREGSAPAYDKIQRAAWAARQPTPKEWARRIDGLFTVLAEQDGIVSGFMSLRMEDGYLDLAFVLPDARGTGVSTRIYIDLETRARVAGLTRLTSHASHMARPFLERQGWRVVEATKAEIDGVILNNWLMEKSLD